MKGLLFVTLLLIHSQQSFAQDSLKFSLDEVRLIALQQTDLRECRGLLKLERQQAGVCDSMNTVLSGIINGYKAEVMIKERVIEIERGRAIAMEKQVKQERKKKTITVGVASVISALCLFIAIK